MAGTSWYVSTCADCAHIDMNDANRYDSSERWCSEKREYVSPHERACSNKFMNDDIKNPPSSEACYLTTIVCEILGKKDKCRELQILRTFREEYLKSDKQYHDLLCEYDIVGPIIASSIRNSLKPKELADFLYETYIKETVKCIEEHKYLLAIEIYKYMVNELKKCVGIKEVKYDENLVPTGKGYIKEKGSQSH